MARTRKTVKLGKILFDLNHRLALSTCEAPVRQGMISIVESLLHDADAYQGFGYLSEEDMARAGLPNEKPGILYRYTALGVAHCNLGIFVGVTAEEWVREKIAAKAANRPCEIEQLFPDESRRHYFVAPALCADYQAAREAAAAEDEVFGPGTIRSTPPKAWLTSPAARWEFDEIPTKRKSALQRAFERGRG